MSPCLDSKKWSTMPAKDEERPELHLGSRRQRLTAGLRGAEAQGRTRQGHWISPLQMGIIWVIYGKYIGTYWDI